MKLILSIALSVLFSAQAFATATDVLPGSVFTPQEDTKVLQVTISTIVATNCPGSVSLTAKRDRGGVYKVETLSSLQTAAVNNLVSTLSKECRAEVARKQFDDRQLFTCLSYGFEKGVVYIPVGRQGEITISHSPLYTVEQIVELK